MRLKNVRGFTPSGSFTQHKDFPFFSLTIFFLKKVFLNRFKASYISLKIISLIPWVKQSILINRFLSQLNGFWRTLPNWGDIFLDKSNPNTRRHNLVKSHLLFCYTKLVYYGSFFQSVNGNLLYHGFFPWSSLYYTDY